jgi:hypothetical protein
VPARRRECIVADDGWIYAGCDDGNVYDLSGKVPRDRRLYIVTTDGSLACIDGSEEAIRSAVGGTAIAAGSPGGQKRLSGRPRPAGSGLHRGTAPPYLR